MKYIKAIIMGLIPTFIIYKCNAPNWSLCLTFWIMSDISLLESEIKKFYEKSN